VGEWRQDLTGPQIYRVAPPGPERQSRGRRQRPPWPEL